MMNNPTRLSFLFPLLLLFSFTSGSSQTTRPSTARPLTDEIGQLMQAFKKCSNSGGKADCETFFNLFPDRFATFSSIYGYDDEQGAMPLYEDAYEHVTLFFRLQSVVPKPDFAKKAIRLGIGGKWDADAVNYLQEGLCEFVAANPEAALTALQAYSAGEISGFWHFFYDGPHPDNAENKALFEQVYKSLLQSDKKAAEVMRAEYQLVLKQEHH